jgi:cytidylate kinase
VKRRPDGIVVAIDGPAASGKSSTARAVAAELGYHHLDSGAFYRAITLAALESGLSPDDWEGIDPETLRGFSVGHRFAGREIVLTLAGADVGDRIREPAVTAHVSRMAAVPAVREWLLETLRESGRRGGMVADGRDIGTVVFPDAELKVFLVCDPDERAVRRLKQLGVQNPGEREMREEARRLVERDEQDQTRSAAPLLRAPDAIVLDTTGLDFAAQVRAIVRFARAAAAS